MRYAVLICVIGLPGCATQHNVVDQRMLMPGAGPAYETKGTQFFVMPIGLNTPAPIFPAASDARSNFELVVCVELWLTAEGEVDRVMPYRDSPECASGHPDQPAYLAAVMQSLKTWEFTPAMICDIPPAIAAQRARGDCTGPEVSMRHVPVRLNYAFTFSSHNGTRGVGMMRKHNAAAAR